MPRQDIYSSKQELVNCEFVHLHRQVGVSVEYFGLSGQSPVFSIYGEMPSLNTTSFGITYPADRVQETVMADTKFIIDRLDSVIAELTGHRERLAAELERLKTERLELPGLEQPKLL